MKKLLIITGDLACGKSTLARLLSARYGIQAYRKDDIKEALCGTISFTNRAENRRLSVASVEMMQLIFAEFARFGDDLILEANFRSAELEHLAQIASANGYRVLTLVLRADINVLYKRFMNRIENENRSPVHQSAGMTDFSAFTAYLQEQRTEKIPGDTVIVDADDFSYQTDESLLSMIDAFVFSTAE